RQYTRSRHYHSFLPWQADCHCGQRICVSEREVNDIVPRSPHKSRKNLDVASRIEPASDRSEWLDLRALQRYACVSERTLRGWIHRPDDPLPAVRVETKLLVRRATFDAWLEAHQIKPIDVETILNEMIAGIKDKR